MARGRQTIFRKRRFVTIVIEQSDFDEMSAEALKLGLQATVWARMTLIEKLRELRAANGKK